MKIQNRMLAGFLPLIIAPLLLVSIIYQYNARSAIIEAELRTLELVGQAVWDRMAEDYNELVSLGISEISFYRQRLLSGIASSSLLSVDAGIALEVVGPDGATLVSTWKSGIVSDRPPADRDPPPVLVTRESGAGTGLEVLQYQTRLPGLEWTVTVSKPVYAALEPVRASFVVTVLLGILVIVFATAITLLLSRRLTQPISVLTERVAAFGDGDYSVRADEGADGEVGVLARQFNAMADTISQATRSLESEVDARTRALHKSLEELKQTQTQLIESEKMAGLGSMVAGFAHELNTPIGVVITAVSLIRDELQHIQELLQTGGGVSRKSLLDSLATVEEGTTLAYQNLTRSADMVNQFKQVAVDQHVDDVKDIYVPTFFLDIRETLSTLLRAKKAQLVYGEICQVSIRSYPGLIWQILSNLARNAVVHGFPEERPGWELRIDAIEIGDKVELRIADNGIGIPIALRPRIFEPFFTTRRSDGSTGLGLHIVYNLVSQKLGGTIRLAADPPPGCVFTIRLPKEVPDSSLESGEVPSS